jgi:hypothetical protein
MNIQLYVASPDYPRDLAATQALWSSATITATAGAYVFLLYLSIPALLGVRSGSGLPARSALDGERERAFLMNITGCIKNDRCGGGIRNPRVQRQACLLGRRHATFSGMRSDYLDFIATAVTLAPLEARTGLAAPVDAELQRRYWRYMWYATSLLGADMADEPEARDRCLAFVDVHAAVSSEGSRLYASLQGRHPRYVERAIPLLPARSQAIIGGLDKGTVW